MPSLKTITTLALLVILPFVTGCAKKKKTAEYQPIYPSYQDSDRTGASLLPSDQAVLSTEDIDTILNAKIALPAETKLAVLRLGAESYQAYDQDATSAEFLSRIEQCPRIQDAAVLPDLLVPDKKSVPYLREAAARYQAGLLLVYCARTDQDNNYRKFHPDETKAYCAVEAVLLDVRTGIVPFSTVAVEEFAAKESPDDFSFSETIRKAEQEAMGKALTKLADELVVFLSAAP